MSMSAVSLFCIKSGDFKSNAEFLLVDFIKIYKESALSNICTNPNILYKCNTDFCRLGVPGRFDS